MTSAVLPQQTEVGSSRKQLQSNSTAVSSGKRTRTSQGRRNLELGLRGEDAAARFLDRRGYEILERNWKCFAGEADIIAKDQNAIVFVEVKTRRACDRGFPAEAVTLPKREKYEKIALTYLTDRRSNGLPIRFDVISIIVIGPNKAMIRHQLDAYSAV